jgi:hypothetical protein
MKRTRKLRLNIFFIREVFMAGKLRKKGGKALHNVLTISKYT